MSNAPTVIPQRTVEQWTNDLLSVFPVTWTSDLARLPGGNLYAVMNSFAANLQVINDFLVYGFDASRIATATDTELDLVADDFYGPGGLPRQTGESDASYRARIQAGLFIPYTTKEAFILAITALTGFAPRMIEPWNPVDTSAYDWSFYDADYPPLRPSLYGDPGLPYQGFIIATLPTPASTEAPTNVWGYDKGAAYDLFTGIYWNLQAANFVGPEQIDALILRIKAFGITIWRKYINQNTLPFPIPNSYQVASGLTTFNISIQPFNGPYIVIASGNWNTALAVDNLSPTGFTITSSTVTPSGARLSYVILPITFPGVGYVPLNPGVTSCAVPIPQAPSSAGQQVAVTPSWDTTYYITAISGGNITITFGTVAPAGGVLYYYFAPPNQSALQPVTEGLYVMAIDIPGMPINSAAFVTPSWNAQTAISVIPGGISVGFSVASPPGGFLHWTYVPLPS